MLGNRSVLRAALLVAASFTLHTLNAYAQSPAPWSGIAADEAKVPGPFNYGSNDMAPRSLSADGRFIVFHSDLPNLVPNDNNNSNDAFLRDRVTRELTRVSVSSAGAEGNGWSGYPSISADGRHVTFFSCASDLVDNDTNGVCDFFVHDRELGTTVRVSVGPNDEETLSTSAAFQARLSGDGRYVAFTALFDTNARMHAWLRDRDTDGNGVFDEPGLSSTTQISTEWIGNSYIDSVLEIAISNDAHYVAFVAQTCLDQYCSNYLGYRMWVHDRITGNSFRVDRPAVGSDEPSYAGGPDFSDNNLLIYNSSQPNLVEGVVNPDGEIYVFNLITGGNVHINPSVALDYKQAPQISADGRYVAFMGTNWNFGNPKYNVYAVDRQTLTTTLVSVHAYYDEPDDHAGAPSMTADGSAIAFAADPGMLFFGSSSSRGIFVATGVALAPAETEVPSVGGTYTIEVTAPATTGWEFDFWGLDSNAIITPASGAGSATVTIEIPENTSQDDVTTFVDLGSEQIRFHQTAPPQIWYTAPYYGPTSGGTDVDIIGTGFGEDATVQFGGVDATNVTFIDSGHLVATTAPHYGGWVNVKVTRANGAYSELFDMFFYEDMTPPIVTPVITGTLGANGWYTSDVTVTWDIVEDDSQIATEPCPPFSLTTDSALEYATCYAASWGGETFVDVPLKRDTVPPTATFNAPQDGAEYSFGEVVPLGLNCADATSGIATCAGNPPGPNLDTTSFLGTHTFTMTAVDAAGHSVTTEAVQYSIRYASTLEIAAADSVYGVPATLQADLYFNYGGQYPGGAGNATVSFFVDNVFVGTAVTAQSGMALLPVTGLNAGTHSIRAEFAGHASIRPATSPTGVLTIAKATPVITWPNPADIMLGTALSETQLNATTTVPGTFVYTPAAGTVLGIGVRQLSVIFTPQDTANYNSANRLAWVWVKGVPVITWFSHAITWPQTLDASVLDATASPGGGSFVYSPPAGALLEPGSYTLSVTFDPSDQNYVNATKTITLWVEKAAPTVTFPATAPIPYGTPLSSVQLNATASVPGTFVYTPAAGTVLPAGTQGLQVVFTPTDTAHYLTITKNKSQVITHLPPTVDWNPPASITWGTPLGPAQQNATSPLAGTFGYWPEPGTVLEVGVREIRVVFNPDDPNYSSPTLYRSITVTTAPSVITWNDPAPIVYGTFLSGTQNNATANVAGTFSYSPSNGNLLAAGTHTLTVTFTPTDTAHYDGSSAQVTLVVAKRTPTITWNNPASIAYGTALSSTHLNATASVAGTFEYSPAAGAVLSAGSQTLSVTFTPTDVANNNSATANVTLVVGKATPSITWPAPSSITYGTTLSGTQLNASADVAGTFDYSPAEGAVLNAGAHTLSVTFTPADTDNYNAASANVALDVAKATPAITWANPAGLTYGQALTWTQLNATADLPGSFSYTPPVATVLNAGTHTLSVTFTPADEANNNSATASVTIVVAKASTSITWSNPGAITYGTALSSTQLNATASVPGTFTYTPASGTVLGAGVQTLSVQFTPTDSANYDGSSADRSIVVNTRALTITANNATKVYGEALPAFTSTGTGFVNGDTLASLNGTLTYTTPATAASAPGSYSVTPGGVSSPNYAITFANGTLTINKASTSVAFTTTPNPSNHNQQVQLRAVLTAVAPGAGTPTGTVEFREGSTLLGTATLVNGVATMNKNFKRGTHSLTATYVGNTNFNGSVGSVTHQTN